MPHYLYQKHVLVSPWSLFIPETCIGQPMVIIYTRNMYWSAHGHYLYQKHVLVSPWSLFIPETCTGQSAHSHYLYQKHVLVSQPMGSCHIVDFKVNTLILKQMFVRKLSVIASSLLCRKKGTQKLCSSM
jgi:hypothetical protein